MAAVQARQISAMQLSKGFKKAQPTFLACLKEEGVLEPASNLPSEILPILESFKDVMPAELPKRLPPQREVDHKIELVQFFSSSSCTIQNGSSGVRRIAEAAERFVRCRLHPAI